MLVLLQCGGHNQEAVDGSECIMTETSEKCTDRPHARPLLSHLAYAVGMRTSVQFSYRRQDICRTQDRLDEPAAKKLVEADQ